MNARTSPDNQEELREANSCLALGAGLGAVGTTTAILAGATCPLCFVLAPALIGIGAWKRYQIRRKAADHSSAEAQDRRA
jgi:lysozyme family protein